MSDTITRYPLVLFRRSRERHDALIQHMTHFDAFLEAQSYTLDINAVRDTEFTAVVHDDQVKFLRRVLEVESADTALGWEGGTHFVTSGRVPAFLKKIEGRPYLRSLRATKYRGVFLCHDIETDEVWIEDDGGRVC